MKHNLRISVSKESENGVVAVRSVSLREKLLTFLFGPTQKVMVLVPGNTVDSIAITETEVNAE